MSFTSLRGVRVLDLGIVTAGASTSAMLADLGAEVIKVEGPSYTDPFREWTGIEHGTQWWDASAQFQATNRNKRSLCLELKSARGRSLFLELAAQCDLVLENFRAGVLDRLHIGYAELRAVNPSVILASISSQGQDGPERENSSFGSTLEASSGLASLMKYPGGVPQITGRGMNYPDQVASLFSAIAILAALIERKRTGQGTWLDLSQRELTSFLIGEALVAAAAGVSTDPYVTTPPGAVEGVFMSRDARWVAVTIGAGGLTQDVEGLGRKPDSVALESWMAARDGGAGAQILRTAGAASEVAWAAHAALDPHALVPQDAYPEDSLGRQVKGLPLRINGKPCPGFRAASLLGEDNEGVMRRLLGLSDSELEVLASQSVLTKRPLKAG